MLRASVLKNRADCDFWKSLTVFPQISLKMPKFSLVRDAKLAVLCKALSEASPAFSPIFQGCFSGLKIADFC